MTTTSTTNYGYRKVSHYPGGKGCMECYAYNIHPCNKCKNIGYELKESVMSWKEFFDNFDKSWILNKCTQMPDSYEQFCELYEQFHDLPELIELEDESEDDNGYDRIS